MAMIQQWQWNNDGHEISMEKAIMAMKYQWQWNNNGNKITVKTQ